MMLLSFALYVGLFLVWTVIGAVPGVSMIALVVLWPVGDHRANVPTTHLDQVIPQWQFREQHATHVAAPPQRVYDSIAPVTAKEILLFKTLVAIRRLGRPAPPSIMNPPEEEPLLHLAARTSFRYVAVDPPKELVLETIVVRPRVAIAAMNFLVMPDGRGGSFLSTETRVAVIPQARRPFAIYWRIIRPGSGIIRIMWLRAIRKRAEL